jgi:hypothetical protein
MGTDYVVTPTCGKAADRFPWLELFIHTKPHSLGTVLDPNASFMFKKSFAVR